MFLKDGGLILSRGGAHFEPPLAGFFGRQVEGVFELAVAEEQDSCRPDCGVSACPHRAGPSGGPGYDDLTCPFELLDRTFYCGSGDISQLGDSTVACVAALDAEAVDEVVEVPVLACPVAFVPGQEVGWSEVFLFGHFVGLQKKDFLLEQPPTCRYDVVVRS